MKMMMMRKVNMRGLNADIEDDVSVYFHIVHKEQKNKIKHIYKQK